MKYLHRLLCLLRGHHYVPSYHHSWRQAAWYLPRTDETFTYECEDCEKPHVIKGKKAHEEFEQKFKPSWGGRGSDSQGYGD